MQKYLDSLGEEIKLGRNLTFTNDLITPVKDKYIENNGTLKGFYQSEEWNEIKEKREESKRINRERVEEKIEKVNPSFKEKSWKNKFISNVEEILEMTENFDEVKEELIKKGYEVNVQNKNITIERENKKSRLKILNKEWNNEYILGYREKTKEAQKSFVENHKSQTGDKERNQNLRQNLGLEEELIEKIIRVKKIEIEKGIFNGKEEIDKVLEKTKLSEYQKELITEDLEREEENIRSSIEYYKNIDMDSKEKEDELLDEYIRGEYRRAIEDLEEIKKELNWSYREYEEAKKNTKWYDILEKDKRNKAKEYLKIEAERDKKIDRVRRYERIKGSIEFKDFKEDKKNNIIEKIKELINKLRELEIVKIIMKRVKENKEYIKFIEKQEKMKEKSKINYIYRRRKERDLERQYK